ncbi:hypothetical protein [Paenibacillus polymyxa]|uniref:hypothetical protein n=1 Tax=Paenibacillus polymyxa TaxID=1406 RepID=UPI0021E4B3F3|nr:hypothetical protein [Paenibacillus polymyxa]
MGIQSKFVWKELVIRNINVLERQGKSNLIFVDLIDPQTYEASGEYLYMPEDRSEQLPPKGTVVDVYCKPGMYNGRPNLSFASVVASKAANKVS